MNREKTLTTVGIDYTSWAIGGKEINFVSFVNIKVSKGAEFKGNGCYNARNQKTHVQHIRSYC